MHSRATQLKFMRPRIQQLRTSISNYAITHYCYANQSERWTASKLHNNRATAEWLYFPHSRNFAKTLKPQALIMLWWKNRDNWPWQRAGEL